MRPVAAPESTSLQVTIVAHDVGPIGGMERQLTELISGLLRDGHQVTVISRTCDLPRDPSLRWIRVVGPARPFPIAYPWFFVVGTWKVWRHRVGLLHTTGAIVWNRADLCTVHYCHHGARHKAESVLGGLSPVRRLNRRVSAVLARRAERLIFRRAKTRHLVAVSRGVARELLENFPATEARTSVIPNAIDHNVFRPDLSARIQIRGSYGLRDSDLLVMFAGGDWGWKGLPLAIQAVTPLQDCHLLVVGTGDIRRYRSAARILHSEGRIHFAGPRKDIARYFAAADVFLLPTAYESFSLVTHEAAAAGLPLLVTRVSGVDEILSDGENGWFTQLEPKMIQSRLEALAADPASMRRMGARSRQAVMRYSWSRVVAEYVSLYRRLVAPSAMGIRGEDALVAAGRR